jgi:hypothetical protein
MGQYGIGYGAPRGGGSTSDYDVSQDDYGSNAQYDYGNSAQYDYSSTASHAAGGAGPTVVSFENVSKHYGNLHAVDGLTLELRQGGQIHLAGHAPRLAQAHQRADHGFRL